MTATVDSMTATCNNCGRPGTLAALALHSCDIQEQGGRCEDYPCCGHTDGDGCQTLPSHTADFYSRNPHLLHEPGSPEWQDAMADMYEGYEPEWSCKTCDGEFEDGDDFENGDSISDCCIHCRVVAFVEHWETREARKHYAARRSV